MWENPVFQKEIKTKLRSRQPLRVQAAIAVIVLAVMVYGYYLAISNILRWGGSGSTDDWWNLSLGLQSLLIWMLTPALVANAVSQEKEQQTWEMLISTLLRPHEIVLGKLAARVLPMLGVLAAFFPFMLFCFARSPNIGLGQLLTTYIIFGVWIFFLTSVGLFASWAFRKTATALSVAYLVVFALAIGTLLINMTLSLGHGWSESWIWWLNPIRITDALIRINSDAYARGVLVLSSITFLTVGILLLGRMLARIRVTE